jgi:hypothetical protein
MNKQIQELAEEAKSYADENHAHYVMNPHWINTFEKRFAELIVRECAQFVFVLDSEPISHQSAARLLQEHFGVE